MNVHSTGGGRRGETGRSRRTRSLVIVAATIAAAVAVPVSIANAGSSISALDYAQCQNGAPGTTPNPTCTAPDWINGVLNANNSQFRENEVTPQRLLVQYKTAGLHSVTLRYLTRKGGVHAYDSLASANTTVSNAISQRCKGIESICPSGSADTTPVVADPTPVNPATLGSAVTSGHQLSGQVLTLFGATFTTGAVTSDNPPAMSEPSHDNASSSTGDDYATTTISFRTTDANARVQLLFGGHLAAPTGSTGWGADLGAASISGGPYHIKWDAADGASVGNRDNQIMSNAILPFFASSLTTQASPTTAILGTTTTVSDTATMTIDAGSPAPTVAPTFKLWGPGTTYCGLNNAVTETPVATVTGSAWVLSSGTTYTSTASTSTPTGAGTYTWHAVYPGETQIGTASDTCGATSEQVVVSQATPTGVSTISVKDSVTVSGSGSIAGRVKFELYGPYTPGTTPDCLSAQLVSTTPSDWASVTLASGSATTPTAFAIPKNAGSTTTEGVYSFVVTYYSIGTDGTTVLDPNNANNTVVKACNTENVTIAYP